MKSVCPFHVGSFMIYRNPSLLFDDYARIVRIKYIESEISMYDAYRYMRDWDIEGEKLNKEIDRYKWYNPRLRVSIESSIDGQIEDYNLESKENNLYPLKDIYKFDKVIKFASLYPIHFKRYNYCIKVIKDPEFIKERFEVSHIRKELDKFLNKWDLLIDVNKSLNDYDKSRARRERFYNDPNFAPDDITVDEAKRYNFILDLNDDYLSMITLLKGGYKIDEILKDYSPRDRNVLMALYRHHYYGY